MLNKKIIGVPHCKTFDTDKTLDFKENNFYTYESESGSFSIKRDWLILNKITDFGIRTEIIITIKNKKPRSKPLQHKLVLMQYFTAIKNNIKTKITIQLDNRINKNPFNIEGSLAYMFYDDHYFAKSNDTEATSGDFFTPSFGLSLFESMKQNSFKKKGSISSDKKRLNDNVYSDMNPTASKLTISKGTIGRGGEANIYNGGSKFNHMDMVVRAVKERGRGRKSNKTGGFFLFSEDGIKKLESIFKSSEIQYKLSHYKKHKGSNNIIKLEKAGFEIDENGYVNFYQYLEKMDKNLHEYAKEYEMKTKLINKIGKDTLNALACLEKNKIIHRDLKPENIFVKINKNSITCKLGDFGSCIKEEDAEKCIEQFPTGWEFQSFELIKREMKLDVLFKNGSRSKPNLHTDALTNIEAIKCNSDVWALGLILIEMGLDEDILPCLGYTYKQPYGYMGAAISYKNFIHTATDFQLEELKENLLKLVQNKKILKKVKAVLIINPQERHSASKLLKQFNKKL